MADSPAPSLLSGIQHARQAARLPARPVVSLGPFADTLVRGSEMGVLDTSHPDTATHLHCLSLAASIQETAPRGSRAQAAMSLPLTHALDFPCACSESILSGNEIT